MHGRVHPRVGPVAVALLVRGQQVAVGREFGLGRFAEALLGRAQPLFQGAQRGERVIDRVLHGPAGFQYGGLGEVAGAAGEGGGDLAVVGRLGPGEEPQQCGLAGAVLADDGRPLTGADGEGDLVEDRAGAVGLGDVLDGQLRRDGGREGVGACAHGTFPEVREVTVGDDGGVGRARTQRKK